MEYSWQQAWQQAWETKKEKKYAQRMTDIKTGMGTCQGVGSDQKKISHAQCKKNMGCGMACVHFQKKMQST
jgi:hypothetical protein